MLNLGQVVPHEALGMANYTKNLFIGVAGAETINLTHHITAYATPSTPCDYPRSASCPLPPGNARKALVPRRDEHR